MRLPCKVRLPHLSKMREQVLGRVVSEHGEEPYDSGIRLYDETAPKSHRQARHVYVYLEIVMDNKVMSFQDVSLAALASLPLWTDKLLPILAVSSLTTSAPT